MNTPIGVTFNNPLNVRPDGRSNWQGVIAIEHTGSGDFLHFDGPPKGWRCATGTVIAHFDKWSHDTNAKLIGGSGTRGTSGYRPGWAPPEDRNDTAGYIARVVAATGFAADAVLNFHSHAHLKPVLVAMAAVEQGASPYTWWNDAQIDWGMAQYGVLPPAKPIAKTPIIGGVAAATTAAAQTIGSVTTPSYPPPIVAPPFPSPTSDPAPIVQQAQTLLQQLAPYIKWAGIALLVLSAGAAAYYWWHERQKRHAGLA